MIEPIHRLLQELAERHSSGMLLLVVTATGSATHIMTLWMRQGELIHIRDRMRRGATALLVLRHARQLRRWQWFDVTPPPELEPQDLPGIGSFLAFEQRFLRPGLAHHPPSSIEHDRLERLFAIQTFMQTMGGMRGDDAFMQLLFDHPPTQAWDELMEACRDHLGRYFGPEVAVRVVDG